MTKEEFHTLWASTYSGKPPISYLFKQNMSDRWLRIHSLPASKRYPENEEDWKILLARQNEIISDLLEQSNSLFLVVGRYENDEKRIYGVAENDVLKGFLFTELDTIHLYELNITDDDNLLYSPSFTEITWSAHEHNQLLVAMANGRIDAFFVSFDKNIIVAPYEGGIDFILQNSLIKDFYRNKYKQWLSRREDGL